MKLTEQQLAQMFQNSKNTDVDNNINDLYASTDASDKRLSDVEKIADNSVISASYQVMNQLQDWSQAIGSDIKLSLKPKFTQAIFNWFKPTIATAAIVTAVYFITPEMSQQINVQQKSDRIMFTSSFEGNADVIKSLSFDNKSHKIKADTISKNNFS